MNWILELFNWAFCWCPRPWVVNPDEGGIKITWGRRVRDCVPGLYWYCPLFQNVIKVNIALQGVRFAVQSVTTADDRSLAVRGAVLYRITNARKAILETDNFDSSLEAVAGGVIESFVSSKTYDELRGREAIRAELTTQLRKEAAGWGIKLVTVYLPDFAQVRNIRVLGGGQVLPVSDTDTDTE